MFELLPIFRKLIIWFPLLAAGVDVLSAGYFWLVQYELSLVYGTVNGAGGGDSSRSILWPGLLVGLALANIGLTIYLFKKQKSANPLRFRYIVLLVSGFFLAPLFILGTAAIAMTAGSFSDLGKGLQNGPLQ